MKKLYTHILLDQSGSMRPTQGLTIDAINEYVSGVKKGRIALTTFNSIEPAKEVIPQIKAKKFPKVTEDMIGADGMTPLYDAIGKTISDIKAMSMDRNVALVIVTDGLENASVEFKQDDIKKMLTKLQDEENWLVMYLGANQDAWEVGQQMGTRRDDTLTYSARSIGNSMAAASRKTSLYEETGDSAAVGMAFTDEERQEAVDD